jgi:hypothetical protein
MAIPTSRKRATVYLSEDDEVRLAKLFGQLGMSRSAVIRLALQAFEPPGRRVHLDGCIEGDGSSIADVHSADLLRGFGE